MTEDYKFIVNVNPWTSICYDEFIEEFNLLQAAEEMQARIEMRKVAVAEFLRTSMKCRLWQIGNVFNDGMISEIKRRNKKVSLLCVFPIRSNEKERR